MTADETRAARGDVRQCPTAELTDADIAHLRALLWAAFPPGEDGFTEQDWEHSFGGTHFMLDRGGRIVAHASVVERELHVDDLPIRTGYVEAVGTEPGLQGRGLGTAVMEAATAYIRAAFALGALGTGAHHFYERLGWRTWRGPTFVRTGTGPEHTAFEDGYVLVLLTPSSPRIDLTAAISCDWRPGDVW